MAAAGAGCWLAAAGCIAVERPNILFILTEDQGAHLSFLGTPGLQTPHMDSLARSGAYFENAFVAYPVCSASKAAIYTSLHNHTSGLMNNTQNYHKPAAEVTAAERERSEGNSIRSDIPTLVERLKAAGYYQGVTHKLHVFPNEKFPYDEFIKHNGREAVAEFIQRAKKAGKPWHLFYDIPESHRPYPNSDKVKIRVNPSEVKPPAYLPDTPVVRQDWAEYLAAVEEADGVVGEALEALRASGEEGNTIIVFLGDHGPTFQHGKMTLYDLGLRTPMIIRAPGMKGGLRSSVLASELDIMPTLLDLLGLEPVAKTHGLSLKPVLAGAPKAAGHAFIFAEIANRGPDQNDAMQERSVFDGRWKLIYRENLDPAWRMIQADSRDFEKWGNRTYAETVKHKNKFPEAYRILAEMDPQSLKGKVPALELYDLKSDPDEMRNLAGDTKSRKELARLYAALLAWVKETRDPGVKPPPVPKIK